LRLDSSSGGSSAAAASPCKSGSLSRWIRVHAGPCSAAAMAPWLDLDGTNSTVAAAIAAHLAGGAARVGSGGAPCDVQDLVVADFAEARGLPCANSSSSAAAIGAAVEVAGHCWQHSHQHEQNVYDFSTWATAHPGNAAVLIGNGTNPIQAFAERGLSDVAFPRGHPMARWQSQWRALGVFGAAVDFTSLPSSLQSARVGAALGVPRADSSADLGFEACGSRGEVAGRPELGNLYIALSRKVPQGLRYPYYWWAGGAGPEMLWSSAVLAAPDQLRHRVAWALAQIFTVPDLGRAEDVEKHARYYE